MLFISGQVPIVDGKPAWIGHLGKDFDIAEGAAAARVCALAIIAQAKVALDGDLDRITRVVKLTGFVAAVPEFKNQPKIVNGASDLFAEIFGDAGRHARAAVGMSSLPSGVAVEIEAIFEFD